MQLDGEATAIEIRKLIEQKADRGVSRGALYATLDRHDRKGFASWETGTVTPDRGGIPRRVFSVTQEGLDEVRRSSLAIARLQEGLSLP